jgi:hypothetical protein
LLRREKSITQKVILFFKLLHVLSFFLGRHQTQPNIFFFEEHAVNGDGKPGGVGDKHYRSYHGHRKIFTITKAMNHSLNGKFLKFYSQFDIFLMVTY